MPSTDRPYVELDLRAIEQQVFQIDGQPMRAVMEMTHSVEMLVYWLDQRLRLLSNLMLQSNSTLVYHHPILFWHAIAIYLCRVFKSAVLVIFSIWFRFGLCACAFVHTSNLA